MSFLTAVSGFMVLLLSVSVVQGQNGWSVWYSSNQICALEGSTVDMGVNYTYPATKDGKENKLLEKFWFTRKVNDTYNNVEQEVNYSGRVKNTCDGKKCTLTISDLRKSDSVMYYFRFITNLDKYFGNPGFTLKVTGQIQVKVSSRPRGRLLLECFCSCPANTHYIWFKNGQEIQNVQSKKYNPQQALLTDRYSCAVRGCEKIPSPPVYAPKLPSVSVSPSGEIAEGSSVTLTCSSDANPAASYTWYKEDEVSPKGSGENFTIAVFRSNNSGNYSCEAQNILGRQRSTSHLIVVAGGGNLALVAGSVTVVLLVIVVLLTFVWIILRKKRSSTDSLEAEERADTNGQPDQGQPQEQEGLQYASIHFSKNQADLYINTSQARPTRHTELQNNPEYAAIRCASSSSTTRTRGQESGEDPAALYSTVHEIR